MTKIIHQTWKDQNLPVEVAAFQQTWKANHPNWEYRFWTDEDNREFLQTHYSWFLPIYDSYENKICRVDAVRYFILSYYGGVFIDLDFECLRPLDELLNGKELVLGLEPSAHVNSPMVQAHGLKHIVCPSLMASQPNHRVNCRGAKNEWYTKGKKHIPKHECSYMHGWHIEVYWAI
ncbi:MAG: hypothetical protein ICV55_02580 [Coleofasciculus sp. C3-bin4]|nr:hypothetical protein [Coleofasciculus sp. C3-bin4]